MNHHARRGGAVAAVLAVLALLPATGAQAATKAPTAGTGAAADIAQTTATLTGTVDPNGHASTYFFQFGPSTLYGGGTPELDAGNGKAAKRVTAPLAALQPFTTYHYRLIVRNGSRIVKGRDRTFKTRRQPLGLTLGATPQPVRVNGSTTLFGNLGGTGNAGRQVVLQSNPFPFTQGFFTTGNPQVVDLNGNFAFPVLGVPVSTQYRVLLPDRPEVASPVVFVGVKLRVTTSERPRRVRRGHRVRFSGLVTPVNDGAPVEIQRLVHGQFVTVARTFARHRNDRSSSYKRRVKVRFRGTYRVLVTPTSGAYVLNSGRSVKVRVKRRHR